MTGVERLDPISTTERIDALDILRGFALLGILIMNVQSFAMIHAAYFDPSQHMDLTGVNWAVWVTGHVFADLKFMAIFSMLFGAGIVLMSDRHKVTGRPVHALHFIRSGWLLGFGLTHAYLIWYGDILTTYALCAFFVFWARNWSTRWLLGAAGLVLAVPLLLLVSLHLSLQGAPDAIQAEIVAGFVPSRQDVQFEIAAYQGSWGQSFQHRAKTVTATLADSLPYFLFWRASGLMLLGMALYKLGVLSGRLPSLVYNRMIIVGLTIGLPLGIASVSLNAAADWDPMYSMLGTGSVFNYIGSLGMAIAYIGAVMRLVQTRLLVRLQDRLAAVGRTALSNYIAQSLVCTALFYGFGLGLFGEVERWGQILIVFAVWTAQLWLSPLWLRHFRFGPLEWVWRSLTYLKPQKMRR